MKTGIHKDSNEVYHSEDHIGSTSLKQMAVSPGHFFEAWKGPRVHKKAYDEGQAVHSVLLEQSLDVFVRRPDGVDGRTKDGKAQLEALAASGKVVLSADVYDSLERRLGTFVASGEAMNLYNGSDVELSHYARDPITGIYIKARPDMMKAGIITDLKTTENMAGFERQIWNYGYHIQAGFYSLVTELTTGVPVKEFRFIAQEKKAPYGVQVFAFNKTDIAFFKEKARELLNRASVCIQEDRFEIYPDIVKKVMVPVWVYSNEFDFGQHDEVG